MFDRIFELYRVIAGLVGASILTGVAWYSSRIESDGPLRIRDQGTVVQNSRLLMGTEFHLTVWAPTKQAPDAAQAILNALDEIAALEQQISSWISSSETSAVNRAAGNGPIEVSPPLRDLVARSIDWNHQTGGAFDVTGGPLFDLWRRVREQGVLPTVGELEETLQCVGQDRLQLDGDTVQLRTQGMKMSFGAIGKGFAADRAALYLRKRGFSDFIIDAGGDLVVGGRRGDQSWEIAIRHPRNESFLAFTSATDCAIATSGDYEQFVVIDGRRFGHIIDPRTGWPVTETASVTVLAPLGVDADALATALTVMGTLRGLEFVNQTKGVEAVFVNDKGKVFLSSGLRLDGDRLEVVR